VVELVVIDALSSKNYFLTLQFVKFLFLECNSFSFGFIANILSEFFVEFGVNEVAVHVGFETIGSDQTECIQFIQCIFVQEGHAHEDFSGFVFVPHLVFLQLLGDRLELLGEVGGLPQLGDVVDTHFGSLAGGHEHTRVGNELDVRKLLVLVAVVVHDHGWLDVLSQPGVVHIHHVNLVVVGLVVLVLLVAAVEPDSVCL